MAITSHPSNNTFAQVFTTEDIIMKEDVKGTSKKIVSQIIGSGDGKLDVPINKGKKTVKDIVDKIL